jgi:hypothetical protein
MKNCIYRGSNRGEAGPVEQLIVVVLLRRARQ